MNTESIKKAVIEAERFITKANECLVARSKTYGNDNYTFNCTAPKESGAVRRTSMDLTRALAEMRKP